MSLPDEKILYTEIQKKLFYIIPERWENIYLYASVIDVPGQKPVGEMYFYYLPKGIIKKKFINGYEIPSIFNIEEEQYSKLVTDVYNLIKKLRESFAFHKKRLWSNINISINNREFKVEYDYEDLNKSEFNSYERHLIWRYNYLNEGAETLGRKDKKIIEKYIRYEQRNVPARRNVHIEGTYQLPVKNIVDYEKTLSIEEAIARSKTNDKQEKNSNNGKKNLWFTRKHKIEDVIDFDSDEEDDDNNITFNNQILNWKK